MSVIIRLQNLPWSANALDIRQYFRGLSIPEGGVHIVGGEQGDAFIAFSTDEDARQAMMLDGGKIKEVKIKLFLSSRAEMQKVIEHARQQSMTLQSFMQMPAPPITAASLQTSLMNQIPNTTVPTIPVSSAASITTVVPDAHQPGVTIPERRDSREMDRDKKDTDSVSSINKDSKRDRKERSRSRDGDRRDRKDRDRDRDRHRDRDRDRDRRRRDRSRSRERSSRRRDRRDRSRTRERSRSRDHTSRDRERDSKRNSRERKRDSVPPAVEEDKNKDQNGDVIILNTFPPAGKDRLINQPPALASPSKGNIMQQQQQQQQLQQQQQPVVTSASWDAPSGPSMSSFKTAGLGSRPLGMPMETSSERQLEGRRLLGSTSFSGDALRPLGLSLGTDTLQSFSRRDPFSTTRDSGISSLSLRGRESWPPGRQASELSRFGRDRVANFPLSTGGFNNDHDDFDREMDPRASYRGGYRGMDFRRGGFPPRDTRLSGQGSSLLDRIGPGTMSQNELEDRRIGNTFPSNDRRAPFRMERGEMDSFQRMDRFDQFDRNQMNERQFPPTRPGMQDRFQREKFGTPEQNFEPRLQLPGNCVEIRNMSIEAGYGDIRRFFQGLHITSNGLKLINDNHGNRVGIAYVKFQKREGKEEALTYNGRPLRGSAVEVLHLSEDIFEKAIDSYKPPEVEIEPESEETKEVVDPFVCLCIKELPSYAKEADIRKLFTDIPVSEIFIAQSNDEIKQDIAYIKFDTHESAQKALNSNTKFMMGQKPVIVAACALEELEDGRKRKKIEVQKVEEPKQKPAPQPQPLIQQPPQSQPQPAPVVENKSEPIQNSKPQDPRSRNEAAPAQDQSQQKLILPQSDCILLRGLPVQANDRDILDFFSDVGLVPLRIHIMLDKFGKPIGDAFCEFNTVEEGARAFTKNGTPLGKQEVSVKPVLRTEMNEALGLIPQTEMPMSQVGMTRMQPHGREFGGRPAGLLGMTPGPPMGRIPLLGRHPGSLHPGGLHPAGQPMDAFGNPGCVVSLENIPFRADIDEILDFLGDFDVSRENIMRRFTDKGLATGDARVAFISPSEAQRAIRELRFHKIRGRQIFMKLLN